MRPLNLILSAFGPFKEVVSIDFSLFGSHLFLINGPTGSGKTTIFDAMSYALYGDPTGDYRDSSFLRSSYADPGTQTFVEFTFEYHGKIYKIKRIPAQERKALRRGKKGVETTVDPESVTLEGSDIKPLSRIKDVKAKVIEIIGLDKSQFEETMMIAQGGFQKLINADTKSRCEIFRKILKTDDLEELKADLKNKDREATEKVRSQNDRIFGRLLGFQTDDLPWQDLIKDKNAIGNLEELIKNAKSISQVKEGLLPGLKKTSEIAENEKTAAIKRKEAALHFNEAKDDYLSACTVLKALAAKREDIQNKRERVDRALKAQQVVSANKAYLLANDDLAQAEKEKRLIADNLPLASAKNDEFSKKVKEQTLLFENEKTKLAGELVDLERKKGLFDQIDQANVTYMSALSEVNATSQACDREKAIREQLEKEIQKVDDCYAHFDENNRHEDLKISLDRSQRQQSELEALKKQLLNYQNLLAGSGSKIQLCRDSQAVYDKADSDYQTAFRHFIDGQACLIASGLIEGNPCPVCGSVHHPHLAVDSKAVPTEDEVNRLKKRRDDAEVDVRQKAKESERAAAEADSALNLLKQNYQQTLGQTFVVDSAINFLNESDKQNQQALAALQKDWGEAEKLEALHKQEIIENIERKRRLVSTVVPEENRAQTRLVDAQKQEAAAKGLLQHLKDETKESSREIVIERIGIIVARQKEIEDSQLDLKHDAEEALSAFLTLKTQQEDNAQKLSEASTRAAQERESLVSLLTLNGFIDYSEAQRCSLNADDLLAIQKEIRKFDDDYSANEALAKKGREAHCDVEEKKDLVFLDDEVRRLGDEALQATNAYRDALVKVQSNQALLKEVDELHSDSASDLKTANDFHQLYLTATGQLNGVSHIDFEVYYQSQLFDEILEAGSKKLNDMTDGRYVFARRKAPLNGQGQFGLEIDVVDYNTGKERPVSTLSGGESFMASLALALSLSEIIQQKAGGIEMDSMFVDEGFGSLDPDSLENAIRILTNLSNSSHRLVGIISHVEALKDSIPLQIVVSKGKDGSTLKVIN